MRDLPAVLSVEVQTLLHDPRRASGASADAGAGRRRGAARGRGSGHAALGARRAGGALSGAARDDPRSRHRKQRRPFVRFFACEEDLSHESPDAPLPDAVASGAEPFLVVGRDRRRLAAYRDSTCSRKSSARGSFDCPNQNSACFRTSRLRFVLATSINFVTPSPFGS